MKQKSFWIVLLVFVVLLGGAYVLYDRMSGAAEPVSWLSRMVGESRHQIRTPVRKLPRSPRRSRWRPRISRSMTGRGRRSTSPITWASPWC